jgi:hypothetical protein
VNAVSRSVPARLRFRLSVGLLHQNEVKSLNALGRDPLPDVQYLDANDFIVSVEIENDTRFHFFGFFDLTFIEATINRVGLLVEMHFHSWLRRARSKRKGMILRRIQGDVNLITRTF